MNTTAYRWGNPAALLPYTTKAGETTKVPEYAVRLLRAFEQLTDEQKEALTVCAVRMAREAVGGRIRHGMNQAANLLPPVQV